jgi:hypothetical protein
MDDAVGPWSPARTITVARLVRQDDFPSTLTPGQQVRPRVEVVQQGVDTDCSDRAEWWVEHSGVVTIAGGVATAAGFGETTVRADCDGVSSASRTIRVVDRWHGDLRLDDCVRVLGPPRGTGECVPNPPTQVTLELSHAGAVAGRLDFGSRVQFSVTAELAGARILALHGQLTQNSVGSADELDIITTIEILDNRVRLTITDYPSGPGPAPSGAPIRQWILTGEVVNFRR